MAIVKDCKGQVLAAAEVTVGGPEPSFRVKRIDCPEKLFAYYFLRGERTVRVDVDDVQFVGRLVTRWQDNHRVWAILVPVHRGEDASRPTGPPRAVPLGDGPASQRRGLQPSPRKLNRSCPQSTPGLVPAATSEPASMTRRG